MPYPWSSGDVLTATDLNDAIADISGSWVDYSASFAIVGSTTNPTLGTSTVAADYLVQGDLVTYRFTLTIGSGWASGSGSYRFKMPFTANDVNYIGAALVVDVSGPVYYPAIVTPYFASLGYAEIVRALDSAPTAAPIGSTSVTWASGDVIRAQIAYQPA